MLMSTVTVPFCTDGSVRETFPSTTPLRVSTVALAPLLAYARGAISWENARREIQRALRSRFRLRLASAGALHPFLLQPHRQRWLAALSRARLLPFRPLYATLH